VKILLVCFNFPPFNAIGAVRSAQLAAFLESKGHDVRVVAGDGLPYPEGLDLPPLKGRVFRARYSNLVAPIDFARKLLSAGSAKAGGGKSDVQQGWMLKLANIYRALIAIPDGQAGWYPAAMRAAKQALRDWTPDAIISSSPPFTGHLVASRLARLTGKPWIAEFRDLFADNPYGDLPLWRRALDRRMEKAVLASATAIVTISPQLARELARLHHKPAHVVMNGFDESEVASDIGPVSAKGRPLRIVYTGIIYPGRRDPVTLFQAIRSMGERGRRVTVEFYGQDLRGVRAAAMAAGIGDQVTVNDPVAYRESLDLQRRADVLLLLLWDDARENGTIPGKLFEFAGAGRPILSVGCIEGAAASLVRDRGLGVTAADPVAIARALDRWIEQIDERGAVPALPASAREGLSRREQFGVYQTLLLNLPPAQVPQ
jgi:glycosyltransferase involved in cell wall biosynthesis